MSSRNENDESFKLELHSIKGDRRLPERDPKMKRRKSHDDINSTLNNTKSTIYP